MIKTILVVLNTAENAERLMRAATGLARAHDAHLVGLHALENLIAYPGIAMHIPDDTFTVVQQSQNERLTQIQDIFEQWTRNEDFSAEWRVQRAVTSTAADRVIESARAADLVIMAQEDRETDRPSHWHVHDRVIRDSGRPVLVIPPDYVDTQIGNTIALGWSGTREATRAAHDLLLLAQPGAEVGIIAIGRTHEDELSDFAANDMARSLGRHGLKTRVVHREPYATKTAEILKKEAFEMGLT